MKGKTYIALIILCSLMMLSGGGAVLFAQSSLWVTAYYAGWEQSYLPASAIDYTAMTHICHFALIPSVNGSVNESGNSVTYNANTIALIDSAHRHGVKVLITVGGWSTQTDFQGAAGSARATFIHNLMNIVRARGYDGLDIDWEPLSSSDQANYTGFAHDLRDSLNATNPNLLLTMATQWAASVSVACYQYFNQVNLMTYDISGLWSGWVTWHNSPIYNDITIGSNEISCNGYVDSWVNAGVPIGKLGIGIDFYGYTYSGATGPRQSISGVSLIKSNDPYSNIMATYYQSQYVMWDTAAQASYLSIPGSPSKWVSFDNELACAKKITYARNKGIGGVIIWELGGGYRSSMPAGQRDLLLKAVKNAVGNLPVDTTKPTVAITSPVNGSTVSEIITVSATASDNNGVVGVQFLLNGSNIGTEDFVSPYSYSWNTTGYSNGSYTLSAVARDASGNTATASIAVIVSNVPDTTAPIVTISAPSNGSTVSDVVSIVASATDNKGVAGVQFQLNGSNLGSEDVTSPYSYSWNTKSASNGVYRVSAIARDAAGNKDTASISLTVANFPDTIAPFVLITGPADGSTLSGVVSVSANASDNKGVAGVQFQLNGIDLGSQVTAPPYNYDWNTGDTANGTYTLSAVATDFSGNTAISLVNVTVYNAPPIPFDSFYNVVTQDNFDRPDELPVSGGKWTTLLNQTGNGTMQVVQKALQAYNGYGRYHAGGVAWDSMLQKGAGMSIVIVQKVADNTYPPLYMYLRMNNKDFNSGSGYCFRYLETKTGSAELAIQLISNGSPGADLVTTSDKVNVGDTLRFVERNDDTGTLNVFINSRKVLSVIDTTYNPSGWYAWLRGYILSKAPRFAGFSIVYEPKIIPLTQPTIPLPMGPENTAQGVSCNPTVSWQESVAVASFRIQASTDPSFTTLLVDQSDVQNTFFIFNGLSQSMTVYWRVQGSNSVGTSDWSEVWSFVTGTGTTLTFDLDKRWNLVSLPITTPYPNRRIQFPSALSSAYTYTPNAGYQSADTLVNGSGYWLKFGASQPASFTGGPFMRKTLSVVGGWNLIGSISAPVPVASIAANGVSVSTRFYGYNGGYVASDTLYPSKAYWVKVAGTGELTLAAGAAAGKLEVASRPDAILSRLNSITATDAAGNSQTIYYGSAKEQSINADAFELPPAPPRGAFDVRYSTGTFAEFADANRMREIPITISTESYPVTLKFNAGKTANLVSGKLLVDGRDTPLDGNGNISIASLHSQIVLRFCASSSATLPQEFALEQNYPNPFNPGTVIKYTLPVSGKVVLRIYNILGEVVATLVDGIQNAGYQSIEWNGSKYSSGVYFYRLDAVSVENPSESYTSIRKMVFIK